MTTPADLEALLATVVEHHVVNGTLPDLDAVVGNRRDLVPALRTLVDEYLAIAAALDDGVTRAAPGAPVEPAVRPLPAFEGFRTVERLGGGGMGEVYKVRDLELNRFVAAKIVRGGPGTATRLSSFLREARAMALFQDRRIVQVYEFRPDADPPAIIMEFVEGFELGRLAPSLEYRQRARILEEVCEAIHHAHTLGIQHRDLKPSNIMLDGSLSPKILDFGLSLGDPTKGHLQGTLHYLAPEQLDPSKPIDARTDVYALGVILYELIAGVVPFGGATTNEVLEAIRSAPPRLPIEIVPGVPEPLQAIALKAMERDPADRYASAHEMALDLRRYVDGLPVLARPSQYASTLAARIRPHLQAVDEWLRADLIHPHEADRLRAAYRQFDVHEDDWIAASRVLTYSQITLYFGAFLLLAGSLFYFQAHRVYEAWTGALRPFVVLGLPFIGLNVAGRYLYRTERRAVAVAFFLAGVSLLPLFLLIWFNETRWLVAPPGAPNQLFDDGVVSNRQLQVTIGVACLWAGWLALRTRTTALGAVFTVVSFLFALAILGDAGLRTLVEEANFDRLALYLLPVVAAYGALGYAFARADRPWIARPIYVMGAIVLVALVDLVAQDGKTFAHLGVSMQAFQPKGVQDPVLIDTLAGLTLNGILFYALALGLERSGQEALRAAATLLVVIAPFSALEPLAFLVETKEYSPRFDWMYLALAVVTAVLSHHRQRKSFYYGGLINAAFALYFIADRRDWFKVPIWAVVVVAAGIAALAAGYLLDARERGSEVFSTDPAPKGSELPRPPRR